MDPQSETYEENIAEQEKVGAAAGGVGAGAGRGREKEREREREREGTEGMFDDSGYDQSWRQQGDSFMDD